MDLAEPQAVGFSAQRLNRLIPLMQRYVDAGKVPGLVVMIARRGQVAFIEARGVVDIARQTPMPPDAIFHVASMTKLMTAIAALMLHEEGLFQIHDPVAKYLPEFARTKVFAGFSGGVPQLTDLERPITIEDLFTHQSGLVPMAGTYGLDPELEKLYAQAGLQDGSLAEVVAKLAALPLHIQPGKAWHYGSSMDVLAHLVEVLAGMPFAEFLQRRIFDPLGMADTGYFVPPEKRGRLAWPYDITGPGKFDQVDEAKIPRTPPKLTSGSGDLWSTAGDYQCFAQALANGGQLAGVRLVSRKTVEFMATNRLRPDQLPLSFPGAPIAGCGFGLGVRVLLDPAQLGIPASPGEFGWGGYFGTGVWIDPAEKLSGVLMAHVGPPEAFWPHLPPLDIRQIVYQAIED